jgi:hypothetical protein
MAKRKHPRVDRDPRTGRPRVRYYDPDGRLMTKTGFESLADAVKWDELNQADKHRGSYVDPMLARTPFGE